MSGLNKLRECAESMADALDDAFGSEHPYSKKIRRFFKNHNLPHRETILKFKSMIDHDDGLLDSVDNELMQLCYPAASKEHEEQRVKEFIALLTSKTKFVKRLLLLPNSNLIGFE